MEITIDLFLDDKSEISIDLVSFNRLDIVTVDRVRNTTLLLESHEDGLWPVILFILVTEELGVDLDVDEWEVAGVLWGESYWVAILDFVFWRGLPVLGLRERYLQLFINQSFNEESLGIERSISKLKFDLVESPWHSHNIGEDKLNDGAIFQEFDVVGDVGSFIGIDGVHSGIFD